MISVVIPLYNKEPIIEKTMMSVLSQDYSDFEVVVVDDGSTDNSVEKIEAIHDSRIRLIRQENGGPSKARNTGVKNAKGEWVLFLDADDELEPNSLAYFANLTRKFSEIKFFCAPFYVSIGGHKSLSFQYVDGIVKDPFYEFCIRRVMPRTGSFICSRGLCLAEPFNDSIRRYEDFEWLFRIYKRINIYSASKPVLTTNGDFNAASHTRSDIKEDFMGHLNFRHKSFSERMALYFLYLSERDYYPNQCHKLYPWLYWRYDWLLIYKLIKFLRRHFY